MKKNYENRAYIYVVAFSLLILLAVPGVKAQDRNENSFKGSDFRSRLYFGGGLGLQFGSMTLIEVSPLVGYKITPKFSIGVSPTYKYYQYNDYYGPTLDLKTNVWGGSIFSRYSIIENVFAHVEYESLLYNTKTPGSSDSKQQYNSFFVGGGYNQSIGSNAGMYILVLWNLNDTYYSPYTNPVIRVGFSVGM